MERIFHHWHFWEYVKSGMYETTCEKTPEEAMALYAEFLRNTPRFQQAMKRVITEWPISCEQFLTNDGLNRIAWLEQASMCIETGVPRAFRAGFRLLTMVEQRRANGAAKKVLDKWLRKHTRKYPLLDSIKTISMVHSRSLPENVHRYLLAWESRGYIDGISDIVPPGIAHDNLAPSYRQIALGILSNDHALGSLGFAVRVSPWYSAIKRNEIAARR